MQRPALIVVQDATHRRVVQDHFPGVRSLRHGVRWPCGPLQHRRQRDRWGTAADSPGSPIANDETGWATASDGTGLDAVRSKTRDAGTDCNTTGDAPSSARTGGGTGSATAGDGTGLGAADDAARSKPGAAGTACNTAGDPSFFAQNRRRHRLGHGRRRHRPRRGRRRDPLQARRRRDRLQHRQRRVFLPQNWQRHRLGHGIVVAALQRPPKRLPDKRLPPPYKTAESSLLPDR